MDDLRQTARRKGSSGAEGDRVPVERPQYSPLRFRQHGIILARPFAKALLLAAAGGILVRLGWPLLLPGALLLALAALVATRAAWRWERTLVVVSSDELRLVRGTLRRRSRAVQLRSAGVVAVEQTLLGRLLGYGTLVVGGLEIGYVSRPAELARMLS